MTTSSFGFNAFCDRPDIPLEAKERIHQAGIVVGESDEARAAAYREMQDQIILEVARLDKQRWNPLGRRGRQLK